jgi:hypothetical protein
LGETTLQEPKVLYHYCSNASFVSIVSTRQLVASGLALSNDTMEGKWIHKVFFALCAADPELAPYHEKLASNFALLTGIAAGAGFCLSEEGDLLSQWRGYADNGSGISIGFNVDFLHRLEGIETIGGKLDQIVYDQAQQEDGLRPMLDSMKKYIAEGAMRSAVGSLLIPVTDEEQKKIRAASARLWTASILGLPLLYTYKNPAFSEEKEWRLIYYIVSGSGETPVDMLKELSFVAKHDRIVPTFRIDLTPAEVPAISEIILGPRNITPEHMLSAVLAKHGFAGVRVRRSAATYR